MAHLMSSAQIERDFSAASLVLPSNRGSMDAERDNVVYWKTNGKINDDLQWILDTSKLICVLL